MAESIAHNGGRTPRVSVIIPVYNRADKIGRALQSVFAQTFTDYEIVVVNDGSTDDTASVLASYGEKIRVVSQANRGLSGARNAGIAVSRGEYVALLDDDDQWLPERLARCVQVLDADPDCVLVYTDLLKVDADGRPLSGPFGSPDGIESPTMEHMLDHPWNVVPSRIMVRRAVLERCGGFDERLRAYEDRFFTLRAREHGHFRLVPAVLLHKDTRPDYPKVLEREPQCVLFIELVRQRYGLSARGYIKEYRHKRARLMNRLGRELMAQERPAEARRCFARVLHYEPASPKAYFRYLKTFIAARGARASSATDGPEV
ncbi:MAG TPA: glycosyltransferase [Candidatus Acidoferrum sp.]|nr:glycosyltransferase [Candidatus Acidoferrum sp.]